MNEDVHKRAVAGVRHNAVHGADGQAARKDLVSAAGDDRVAGLNALVGQHIDNLRLPVGVAAQHALQPRGGQFDTRAAGGVRDLEQQAVMLEDRTQTAHNAIRRDDGVIALQSISRAFVQNEQVRLVRARGADDLRGHGLVDVLLLEAEQGLQPLCLAGILGQTGLLDAQAVHFLQ